MKNGKLQNENEKRASFCVVLRSPPLSLVRCWLNLLGGAAFFYLLLGGAASFCFLQRPCHPYCAASTLTPQTSHRSHTSSLALLILPVSRYGTRQTRS